MNIDTENTKTLCECCEEESIVGDDGLCDDCEVIYCGVCDNEKLCAKCSSSHESGVSADEQLCSGCAEYYNYNKDETPRYEKWIPNNGNLDVVDEHFRITSQSENSLNVTVEEFGEIEVTTNGIESNVLIHPIDHDHDKLSLPKASEIQGFDVKETRDISYQTIPGFAFVMVGEYVCVSINRTILSDERALVDIVFFNHRHHNETLETHTYVSSELVTYTYDELDEDTKSAVVKKIVSNSSSEFDSREHSETNDMIRDAMQSIGVDVKTFFSDRGPYKPKYYTFDLSLGGEYCYRHNPCFRSFSCRIDIENWLKQYDPGSGRYPTIQFLMDQKLCEMEFFHIRMDYVTIEDGYPDIDNGERFRMGFDGLSETWKRIAKEREELFENRSDSLPGDVSDEDEYDFESDLVRHLRAETDQLKHELYERFVQVVCNQLVPKLVEYRDNLINADDYAPNFIQRNNYKFDKNGKIITS